MKRIIVMVFGVIVAMAAFAQTKTAAPAPVVPATGPKITWENPKHDFGDITQGEVVEYTYKFTNTGTEPLIITNVSVSCGCTIPKGYPRDPIAVNGKGEIVIAFNSTGKIGNNTKVITIVSNAVNPEAATVSFTTNVLQKPATPQ